MPVYLARACVRACYVGQRRRDKGRHCTAMALVSSLAAVGRYLVLRVIRGEKRPRRD